MGGQKLKIREDILKKVASAEASKVTPFMSHVFLRLVNAPPEFREGGNVLRFTTKAKDAQTVTTAWAQVAQLAGVSPRVARKALTWLDGQDVLTLTTSGKGLEVVISFEGISKPGESG
jgi:hypothetical protein